MIVIKKKKKKKENNELEGILKRFIFYTFNDLSLVIFYNINYQ